MMETNYVFDIKGFENGESTIRFKNVCNIEVGEREEDLNGSSEA